ncbi:MAG TPA: hypothetical protein EYQ42_07325 [Thiotrichaceae bacterium]|jgi:hypothetical protein|nr:hypothetical protein [Thiotrichaceae bacterium]HIM07988.1 hypothetical protein [Gammaproteobacteria bacterium]
MASDDDKVGYKKPPQKNQFKPGKSGNPKGRPKGLKNLATDLQEELEQKIVVTEGNKPQEITKQRAMIKTLFAKAMKGDIRASNVVINLILGLEQTKSNQSSPEKISEDDQAILDAFLKNALSSKTTNGENNDE